MRMVTHGKRFPREFVDVPPLEVFKALLEWVQNHLVQWNISLPMAVVLEFGDLLGSFQHKTLFSVIL